MLGNRCGITARLILVVIFPALLFFGHKAVFADPLDTWNVRNSSFTSDLYGIVYANGLYVAVGNNGTVATSTDQVHWTVRTVVSSTGLTEPALKAVTFGNGLFVAVGTYIWTSPDGATWTYRPCSVGGFTGVAYGSGRFVAAGGTGGYLNPSGSAALATSEDGITWVDRSATSGVTTEPTFALIFAAGKFIQVCWHQAPYYSTDGLTWQSGVSASGASLYNHGVGAAYGNGVYVVVGNYIDFGYGGTVLLSTDGIHWTRGTGPAFSALAFGNGFFVATGSDTATPPPYSSYTSTNGVTWADHPNDILGNAITASPGSFTLVGGDMSIVTTTDGVTWTVRNKGGALINAAAVAYGNDLFVTAGPGGSIFTSPDGSAWTGRSNSSLSGTTFASLAYGASGFVAAGSNGSTGATSIAMSGDGVNWTQAAESGPDRAIAFGNGVYVGVAGSTVYSSPNGASWTARASASSGALNGATFGNGKFVVVGDSVIMTSSDGINWSSGSSGVSSRLVSVAAGNNIFAAVGDDGTKIRVSTDGTSWSSAASGLSSGALTSIAYGAGRFVAVGTGSFETDSPDGKTWTVRSLGVTAGPWAVAYGNGTFVAVSGNTIVQSDPLAAAPDAPGGSGGSGGGGCFIATAAYGSDFAWQVRTFKEFRDRRLMTSPAGRAAVRLYYRVSPPVAAFISGGPFLKSVIRFLLTPAAYGVRYPWHSAAAASVFCLFLLVVLVRGRVAGGRSSRDRRFDKQATGH
jgi:hypothetical protein